MENIMKCPCRGCVCKVICQHKTYKLLIRECELVWDYITTNNFGLSRKHTQILFRAIKPKKWGIKEGRTKIMVFEMKDESDE
jgi:hypothetical protein